LLQSSSFVLRMLPEILGSNSLPHSLSLLVCLFVYVCICHCDNKKRVCKINYGLSKKKTLHSCLEHSLKIQDQE